MQVGRCYVQHFATRGPLYFYAERQLKSGGFAGLMVDADNPSRPGKAKRDSVSPLNFRLWTAVANGSVPPRVRARLLERM